MSRVSSYEGARQQLVLCCLKAPEHKLRELWGFGDRQWDVCEDLRKKVRAGELQDAKELEGKIVRSQKMKKIIERRSDPDNWRLLQAMADAIDTGNDSANVETENETSSLSADNDGWHVIPESEGRSVSAACNMPSESKLLQRTGQPGVIDTRMLHCGTHSRTPSPPDITTPPGLHCMGWRAAVQGAENSDNGPSYRDKLVWPNQQHRLPTLPNNVPYQNNPQEAVQWRQPPVLLPPSIPSEVCTKLEQLPLAKANGCARNR